MPKLTIDKFLEKAKQTPIIDVRSPAEFEQGHIVGAVNIPLFENDERAKVGTRYKQVSKESAFLLGLEIVGPKLSDMMRKALKVAQNGEILVHCWRGGMRSGSFAMLLNSAGLQAHTLEGGYKSFRSHTLVFFDKSLTINILAGKTGSGKTDILKELAHRGEQILDLEGLAHHKGSAYGMLGQAPQPSSEHFENLIYQKLSILDTSKPIWIEDESHNVGKCFIPNGLWQQMRVAQTYFIDVPKEIRIKRLMNEYADFDKELLINSTDKIKKRLGGQHHKAAIEAIEANELEKVADITLTYYDKSYLHGLASRVPESIKTIVVNEDNPSKTAEDLIQKAI
jgi:tRNA 2-selenouridine synthase